MKTLKDYVEWQKFNSMSDLEIITAYFRDNGMEEEGMDITYKLARAKIEQMQQRNRSIKEWAYTIPSDYLYDNYPVKTATMLHRIELDYIVNGKVSGVRLDWARENIPELNTPHVYFQPCLRWLQKQGIDFKDVEEIGRVEVDWFDNYVED